MSFLYEYLLFLAQAITLVAAILIVVSVIAGMGMKQATDDQGALQITKLNERLRSLRHAMEASLLPADAVKKAHKREDKEQSKAAKEEAAALKGKKDEDAAGVRSRVFVLDFVGDVKASHVEHLRREVTAVLTKATPQDEVVVAIESPGGMVHGYGLAASQLMRVRDSDIPLTAVVDKVAASGGYMMAAVANKVLAAPFALVGSIGVVAQVPNVHRLLKKNDVDVEVLTAGKYKRTLTLFGENTDEGRDKFVEELEDVHALFQEFVADNREGVDLDKIATGEAWYGKRALDLNLVDGLCTSDEYLTSRCEEADVYEVKWVEQVKPIDKLLGKVNGVLDHAAGVLEMWRR